MTCRTSEPAWSTAAASWVRLSHRDHHPDRAARHHEPPADPADPAPQGPGRWALRHVRRRRLQRARRFLDRRAQPRPDHHRGRSHLVLLRFRARVALQGQVRQLTPLGGPKETTHVAGGGNAIRGSRVGAGPMGEAERGEAAPRQAVTYFCSHEHRSVVTFAVDAVVPESWDCPKCGLPASLDSENPPPAPKIEPYKTHLAYVKERRSDAEAESILDEAIQLLRSRRKSGDIIF